MAECSGVVPIRVLIVDDHPMVRRGLCSLLSSFPDISVVGEANDGATALDATAALAPDVILLDVQMAGVNGIQIAARMLNLAPHVKIVILTAYDNDEYVVGAFRAGVYAYLLKNSSDETVIETIRLVQQGRRLLSPALLDQVLQQLQVLAQARASRESELSSEDIHVLAQIANGATTEDIASELHCSERTVKRKIEEIALKLRARNRSQAVAVAIRAGLI